MAPSSPVSLAPTPIPPSPPPPERDRSSWPLRWFQGRRVSPHIQPSSAPQRWSLRWILILPLVLQTVGPVALVGYLSLRNGQRSIEDLTLQLGDEVSARVTHNIDATLSQTLLTTQANAAAAQLGLLNFTPSLTSERYLFRQVQVAPTIDSAYLGSSDGLFSYVGRGTDQAWVAKVVQDISPERAHYRLDASSGQRQALVRQDSYDPRKRPWYKKAIQFRQLVWSKVYVFTDGRLGLTAAMPVYADTLADPSSGDRFRADLSASQATAPNQGPLQGVVGVDVALDQLSQYLHSLKVTPGAELFIVERSGAMIASSDQEPLSVPGSDGNEATRRLAIASQNPQVRETVAYLQQKFHGLPYIQTPTQAKITLAGETSYLQVVPYQDAYGLDWLVALIIPERDFMETIWAHTRYTIMLCGLTLIGSVGLSVWLARRISAPIQTVSQATYAMATGALEQSVRGSRILEVDLLARSFNRMSQQVRDSFSALEQANEVLEERVADRTAELAQEHQRAESLLHNILPESIAKKLKLKHDNDLIADSFEEVTILFADLVGFTPLSSRLPARELVDLLNKVFCAFDHLAGYLGLEKIKTIGDAYMVAAGLPEARPDHAQAIAEMALEMQTIMSHLSIDHGEPLQIRIGINSGTAVAGVIGTRKFIYDLWGDAVNIAARMESSGEPGLIQVTAATYRLLQEDYDLVHRGAVSVKGKGEMQTYWLQGRKSKTQSLSPEEI